MSKIKIGITGGIGSGKTTVAKNIEKMGFPVFYTDDVAKSSYQNTIVKNKVINLLGEKSYQSNGEVNKDYISKLVFSDRNLLAKLNNIIHPFVASEFETWLSKQSSNIVFKESAILFEMGINKQLDHVILVVADLELRIKRVMSRDNINREAVLERMRNQWNDEQKREKADFIIVNNDIKSMNLELKNCLNKILICSNQ
jgi:dephospho-CoA kinase